MLTAMDDTLWHQIASTFDHVGTSDPRFFDRHWFAFYAPGGHAAAQLTMGVYRNMNVLDGAAVVINGGRQYNARASQSLGRAFDMRCGPIRIETLRPLQAFRLDIDAGTHLRGEIEWRAIVPPHEEQPHFRRQRARVVEDYQRFDQIGVANGWLETAGQRIAVERWWACRDHSWGVRPRMGIREPVTGEEEGLDARGFTLAFLFFSTDTLAGHVQLNGREGEPRYTTGMIRDIASGREWAADDVTLEVELYAGTRRFRHASLGVTLADGTALRLDATAQGAAIAMQGLGYSGGYDDRKGLGVWRGEQRMELDCWDVSAPARIDYGNGQGNEHWHRIQPVAVSAHHGDSVSRGNGSMTLVLSGRIESLGLI
ncbi:MAG: hypothetical protein IT492_03960 [Gammaproteobacteria bacterium]|nr:hypothetical protein [Gammaproteobacteria bacterium]